MNAIKRIVIENFQSHQKTVIEPATQGNLTVVVGPSDSGKTAIIRALRWLFYNIPQGTDFIRGGCKFARVSVEFESGHIVIRERSASKNQYKIIAPGAEAPEVFEGFGNNVPLEVIEITGVRPVTIGDTDYNLNLAEQLDGPFLGKSVSAGARAKVLGKLAGTEEIDYASKEIGTDLYRKNREIETLTTDLSNITASIKQYDYLPQLAEKIATLEQLFDTMRNAKKAREKLSILKHSLAQVAAEINTCNQNILRWQHLPTIESFARMADTANQKRINLINLSNQHKTLSGQISRNNETIKYYATIPEAEKAVVSINPLLQKKSQLKKLQSEFLTLQSGIEAASQSIRRLANLPKIEPVLAKINEITKKRTNLVNLKAELQRAIASQEEFRGAVVVWENRVNELEKAYHDALDLLGICPTCGQPVKKAA